MFDPKRAKLGATCELPGITMALCRDPASGAVFAAGTDGAVYGVQFDGEQPPLEQAPSEQAPADKVAAEKRWTHHDNYVSSLVWLDGVVVSGGFDRRLVWTDTASGQRARVIDSAHDGWVRDLAPFPDGRRLASVGDDMLVKVWDAESGRLLQSLEGHAKQTPQGFATALYTIAVSPDGRTIASGDRVGDVCLWSAETGALTGRLQAPAYYTYDAVKRSRSIGGIRCVCFSPDGAQLALGGIGAVSNVDGFVGPCRVEVWDWRSGKRTFAGQDKHQAVLNDVAFHPCEPWLVAAGGGDSGGILAFWDQQQTPAAHKVKPKGHLQRLVIDAAAQRIVAAGHGGIQLWNI